MAVGISQERWILNTRDRKKARTRRALGEAAIRLFVERGFERTTIEDIVDAAGTSRRTFFRYFPTKEAAFFAGHDDRLEQVRELLEDQTPSRGAWQAVCDALLETACSYEADRAGAVAWRHAMRSSESLIAYDLQMDAEWEKEVAAAFRRSGSTSFEASARAGAVMGVVRAVLVEWYEGDGQDDLVSMGRQALDWLGRGMAEGPPGVEVGPPAAANG